MKKIISVILVIVFMCALSAGDKKKAIYNPELDVKSEILKAQVTAAKENKHILLKFGANWCPWCRALYGLMHSDGKISSYLQKKYIVILVDIGETKDHPLNRDLMEKYRVKGFGFPALAVLDAEGKLLVSQSTGVLEQGKGHDPEKVYDFLVANAP